jgi:FAD/FMN-containing dehydrogenase
MNHFLDQLRAIVGDAHVLWDGDLTQWEQDWRRRVRGKALAVVRPANVEEVAATVRCCLAAGHSIVPQGGNTGLAEGSTPDASGSQVVLSLTRLNAVRNIDTANLTMTVEAGCVLQTVQEAAASSGLLFPLSLAAEGSCTIGGNLATNAGGTQVLRYGNARELCLGLEVVTPDGRIWRGTSGLRKDNTGYALRDLMIGSEGTLGIITAATLKLYPQPAARLSAWVSVPSMEQAVALLSAARTHLGEGLTAFEFMDAQSLQLVQHHMPQLRVPLDQEPSPYSVLLEHSDSESETHARMLFESLLESALDNAWITNAAIAESLAQSRAMWHVREHIPLAQAQEGPSLKHDISVEISKMPAFVAHTGEQLAAAYPDVRLVNFGHLGDGNLHYNVQAPAGMDAKTFAPLEDGISDLVYAAVLHFGGSFSAEHGIGGLKRGVLATHKSAVELDMMRAIKAALDPHHLLNPGRVLPDAAS